MNVYDITSKVSVMKVGSSVILIALLIAYFKLGFTGSIIVRNLAELLAFALLFYYIKKRDYLKIIW
jgi:hypothetical protein